MNRTLGGSLQNCCLAIKRTDQKWSFVLVLTQRFILTKDADYLYPNKANWSFISDSNGCFFFTKEASSRWTNEA